MKNNRKTKLNLIIITFATLIACTFTTTRIKNPEFQDNNKLKSEIELITTAEAINIGGKEIEKSNQTTTELFVEIINANELPKNQENQKKTQKNIALLIKKNLKNPLKYDNYKISFIVKKGNNIATKKMTFTNTFYDNEL